MVTGIDDTKTKKKTWKNKIEREIFYPFPCQTDCPVTSTNNPIPGLAIFTNYCLSNSVGLFSSSNKMSVL